MEQPKSALDHYERGRVLKHAPMFDEAFRQALEVGTFSGEVSKRIPC